MFIKHTALFAMITVLSLCFATTTQAQHDDHDHDNDHKTSEKQVKKSDSHNDHDDHDHANHDDKKMTSSPAKHDEHEGHDHSNHADDDQDDHDDHAGHGHDEHEDGPIKLDADMLKRFDIRLSKTAAGNITRYTTLSGEVVFNSDRIAHVTTPVSGIVSQVQASMGDVVTQGQTLASISSRELAALRSDLLATRARWELAKENASRDERLFKEKVGTERALLESKQAARDAQIQYALAENALHALGYSHLQIHNISDEEHNLSSYELTAPITGTITHLTLGENISADSNDPAFIIADTRSVWVNLAVYQRDLAMIKPGNVVDLQFGHHLPDATGRIAFITPVIDERTRTATARIVLDNPQNHYRPGLFVTGKVHTQSTDVSIAVPTAAVVDVENKPSVFIQTPEGLEVQPVKVGQSDLKTVEILEGLKPGQTYVSHNAFALKAQMQKGAFGHAGHAH
jgi:cobalt-zinc-cadmium efflux system membrane fusion protein